MHFTASSDKSPSSGKDNDSPLVCHFLSLGAACDKLIYFSRTRHSELIGTGDLQALAMFSVAVLELYQSLFTRTFRMRVYISGLINLLR